MLKRRGLRRQPGRNKEESKEAGAEGGRGTVISIS